MTVAELIKELEKMPQDYKVVFFTLDDYGEGYTEEVTWLNQIDSNKEIELC